jgi:hypothetical protein
MDTSALSGAAALAAALVLATHAGAVDKCKAAADKRSGVIHVDATGVGGPLAWGGAADETVNAFFNAATCLKGSKAKGCELADPASLSAKTPPDTCTVHLDDGVQPCAAWIPGCTPGPRNIAGLDQCVEVSSTPTEMTGTELTLNADCPAGLVAVSGGFGVGAFTFLSNCVPYRSRRLDADTWSASWFASGSNCAGNHFRATAVCCPP